MRGLSTIGSISFGDALVAGKKRVPLPATGKTAVRIRCIVGTLARSRCHDTGVPPLAGFRRVFFGGSPFSNRARRRAPLFDAPPGDAAASLLRRGIRDEDVRAIQLHDPVADA